jgi:hypothetical protein
MMEPNLPTEPQNLYWLFSSSAQAIATFMAFLLTGFAIVLQIMDSARARDETLQPLYEGLTRSSYWKMVVLAIMTAISVACNLAMTYINGLNSPLIHGGTIAVGILNLLVIGCATWFVVIMVNPHRSKKVALELLGTSQKAQRHLGTEVRVEDFFGAFVAVEREIREYLQSRDLYENNRQGSRKTQPGMRFSFREMVGALYSNKVIDARLRDELLDINRTRNLVFHGHIDRVEDKHLKKVEVLREQLKSIFLSQAVLGSSEFPVDE